MWCEWALWIQPEEPFKVVDGLTVVLLMKPKFPELEGGNHARLGLRPLLVQFLQMEKRGAGLVVAFERQADQKLCGHVTSMLGKKQGEAFEFGYRPIVFSKPEQMQSEIVDGRPGLIGVSRCGGRRWAPHE